jgi:hypothetical protein
MADPNVRDHGGSALRGTLSPDGQTILNVSDATVVHLGDARRLAPGQSIEVPTPLARELRAGGHCQ